MGVDGSQDGTPFSVLRRRYSQIAALASKLHFHPSVGLPPKYALQVFPLTADQLQQRFDGLRAFLHEVFAQLLSQYEEGMHHDVTSNAGLDMQNFFDFVSHHRNLPPKPVRGLPEWAKPTILHGASSASGAAGTGASWSFPYPRSRSSSSDSFGTIESARSGAAPNTWQDVESVDEDVKDTSAKQDVSNDFRNELLQTEGNVNALWNCVRAYMRATDAWWVSAGAVMDEYKRIGEMSLLRTQAENGPIDVSDQDAAHQSQTPRHSSRLAATYNKMVDGMLPEFEQRCEQDVLQRLDMLMQGVLPEVKHSYWTRMANLHSNEAGSAADNAHVRRLKLERTQLQEKIREDVQESMIAFVKIQNGFLKDMHKRLQMFESADLIAQEDKQHATAETSFDSDCNMSMLPAVSISINSKLAEDEERNGGYNIDDATEQTIDSCTSEDANVEDVLIRLQSPLAVKNENEVKFDDIESNGDEQESHDEDPNCSRMWVWGRSPSSEAGSHLVLRPKRVSILHGQSIVQMACGGEHVLYLTDTGDVYSYGDSDDKASSKRGYLSSFIAPRLIEEFALEKALHRTQIISVACGAQHSLGITDGGEVYTWGSGEDGRLGHGDMRDRSVPRKVMSLLRERVIQASCGGAHTAVLTDQGKVFTFGRGRNGRLGLGDTKWRDTPHEITAFPGNKIMIIQVVCGWNFTVALAKDGSVFSWGKQGEGQCGLGYLEKDQLVPRHVEKLSDSCVIDIACGYTHTLALTAEGEVYSWGLGEYGQLGRSIVYQPIPELVDFSQVLCAPDRITQVYCGAFHSITTSESRVMFAWGLNMYGACGLGHTVNKDSPERIDCFSADSHELVVACGHKYTVALQVNNLRLAPHAAHFMAQAVGTKFHQEKRHSAAQQHPSSSENHGGENYSGADGRSSVQVSSGDEWAPDESNSSYPRTLSYGTMNGVSNKMHETREIIHEKEEELRRAKKVWRTRILRDWEDCKDTPLAHSMWRQGIPPSIRARVWPLAIGNKLKITPDMYQIYRKRALAHKKDKESGIDGTSTVIGREHTLALIDTDLPRTFPSLKLFDASGPFNEFLLEVLETYACYRPDLGYIQGMSYLAAMLCLHMPQDRYLTFQCLANLMVHEHLFTFYLLDADLSGVYYKLFDAFLCVRLPELHAHLNYLGMPCSMYLMNWLQTLFLQVLPLECAARVFDNFLLDGTVFLFRTAMAIHELLQPVLIGAEIDSAMPILQKNLVYQDLWNTRVSEEELFRIIPTIAVPSHIYAALDRVVNDVFFFEKTNNRSGARSTRRGGQQDDDEAWRSMVRGGQSAGIGRVKYERRRMYSISDTLNGVLGGF